MLETDASIQGLGAVLSQRQADGKIHPIAYASRSLNTHERNYGITELETLGLVWAARLFRPYLLGCHCVVFTDHAACTSLLNCRHPSAKLSQWALIVQELDLEIRHRSGKQNLNADALSRNPAPTAITAQSTSGKDYQNRHSCEVSEKVKTSAGEASAPQLLSDPVCSVSTDTQDEDVSSEVAGVNLLGLLVPPKVCTPCLSWKLPVSTRLQSCKNKTLN